MLAADWLTANVVAAIVLGVVAPIEVELIPAVAESPPVTAKVGVAPQVAKATVVITPLLFLAFKATVVLDSTDAINGLSSVGLVANTNAPVPVSSVTADARFADDGVPRKVATPLPRLVIPVPPLATGKAVPEYVMASVPAPVIGLPEIENTLGTVAATLVTVPPDEGELFVTVKLG